MLSVPGTSASVQRQESSGAAGGLASAEVSREISAAREAGAPVPVEVRRPAEKVLGADLSKVRIHSGGRARQMAGSVGADAFAIGQRVYLDGGRRDAAADRGNVLAG